MSTITSVIVLQPTTTPTTTLASISTSISEVPVTVTTNTITTLNPLSTIIYIATSSNAYGQTIISFNIYGSQTTTSSNIYGSQTTASSNTGDIVGGVVGGIAAICLLAFLLFYIRRHRRRILSFPVQGRMPLRSVGNNIAPFPHPERDVNQYGDNPNVSAGASDGVGRAKSYLNTALQPPDLSAYNYSHDARPLSWEIYQPFVRPTPRPHAQDQNINAMPQRNRYNPRMETMGHDLATRREVNGDGSSVVQYQDAGRVPSESGEMSLRDIPPTYESIVR